MNDPLGSQGGDLRGLPTRDYLDLSTCVNRYGPSPAALAALHDISDNELRIHPYGISSELEAAYSRKLQVDASELLAGRGTTEFIWSLSRLLDHAEVAIPFPAYTDFINAFPGRGNFFASSERPCLPGAEQIAQAMCSASFVLISNPNNPTGAYIPPEQLVDICRKSPGNILCVDESYVDFLPDSARTSLAGSDLENLLVLQSPSKFYGIAGVRTGIAWTRNQEFRRKLQTMQDTWPLSLPEVRVAVAAIQDEGWASEVRLKLLDDAAWLEDLLSSNLEIAKSAVHFRFGFSAEAEIFRRAWLSRGIVIRALGESHGVKPGGVRIASPKSNERDQVASVFRQITTK